MRLKLRILLLGIPSCKQPNDIKVIIEQQNSLFSHSEVREIDDVSFLTRLLEHASILLMRRVTCVKQHRGGVSEISV